jgi:surface protein
MNYLFNRASSFNGDISSWDVRKVTKMRNLFYRDESFNGDISGWDVSNVNNMRSMFNRAFSFNQGIGDWDVSSVTKMKYMLHKATVFNQDLSGWCVENISVEPTGFSSGSSLAIHNEPVWGYCNSTIFSEHKHIQAWKPGNAFSDEHGWIEVGVGDMPLVISAPHGGTRKPKNIPDRTCGKGGGVTVADSHVGKLAFVIRRQLKIQNNKQPYVIVAGIARSKVDLNRNLENATCGNKKMKDAWRRYHDNIDKALAKAVKKFGYAIFIDLHGQGHKKHRLELGYKPTKKQIKEMYLDSDKAEGIANKTSLANLLNMNSELNITELIWGKNSFGTLIAKKGFPAVPSRQDPYPLQGDPYFDGGYNTRRYTSSKYPRVFGWQIESNYKGVRDAKGRPKFAEAFAKVIMTYINENIKK